MPKATAVWLLENTKLTYGQIANFCGLHYHEVEGINNEEVAQGIKGINPITNNQLTKEELQASEKDPERKMHLSAEAIRFAKDQSMKKKKSKYIPKARRQDKPNAILWLLKHCPEMNDTQISKLIGTTKNTITIIKEKKHWNYSSLRAQDPVLLGLCSQSSLNEIHEIAKKSKSNTK